MDDLTENWFKIERKTARTSCIYVSILGVAGEDTISSINVPNEFFSISPFDVTNAPTPLGLED